MRWEGFLILLLVLPFISSVNCDDQFLFSKEVISLCGYCSEENGTICSVTRECNFTIYTSNFTQIGIWEGINYGDGSVVHNISQNISGGNLSVGTYFGDMNCYNNRSKDSLSFVVLSAPIQSGGGGGSTIIYPEEEDETLRIPKDIKRYLDYTLARITPTQKGMGILAIFLFFLILIFGYEIYKSIKRIRIKKW